MQKNTIITAAVLGVIAALILLLQPFGRDDKPKDAEPAPKRITALGGERDSGENQRVSQMRRIINDRDSTVRWLLFKSFIYQLEPEEFPDAFESLIRIMGRQRSHYYDGMISAWAEIDPLGAWQAVRPMFDIATPERWTDHWNQKLIATHDPAKLARSKFWPSRSLFFDFHSGLNSSDLPAAAKAKISAEFEKLFSERIDPDYEFRNSGRTIPPPSPDAFLLAEKVAAASADELPELLREATATRNYGVFLRVLRKQVLSDLKNAPDAFATALAYAENAPPDPKQNPVHTERAARSAAGDVIRAWASRDPFAAWDWLLAEHPESLTDYTGDAIISHLDDPRREQLLEMLRKKHREEKNYYTYETTLSEWARSDPAAAFKEAAANLEPEDVSDIAQSRFDDARSAADMEKIAAELADPGIKLTNESAAMSMEDWGDADTAAAARFGVAWLLESEEHPRDAVLSVWKGEADPDDGLIDDRTFGCLRCWALARPDEMQSWIESQEEPEVREALQWLHENAAGRSGDLRSP